MSTLLHLVGSPRSALSASKEVADAYIHAYAERHPGTRVDVLDVWAEDLPHFDEDAMNAKYAGIAGTPLTAPQQQAWDQLTLLAARFHAADVVVASVPMWNFGIPYRLKHLIDLVSQKNLLFSFDAQGFGGLLKDKHGVLVCARGLNYASGTDTPEAEFDFQKSYMGFWFKFIGITDLQAITVSQTLFGPEADTAARQAATAEAVRLARAAP